MDIKLPKVDETAYFTNRSLKDEEGNVKGRIILYKLKGEEIYHFYLKCPNCGKESKGTKEFKRRPYRVECPHCGYKVVVTKIAPKK